MQSRLRQAWEKLARALATGAGVGLAPVAPGTFGSLWGLAIAAGLQHLGMSSGERLAALALVWLAGVPVCARAAESYGQKDPGKIVYDELAALPLAFVAAPFNLATGLVGFAAFRLFDIAKPWPVRRLEKLPGGWGIMADDLMAAAYAALIVWGVAYWRGAA